MSSGPGGGGVHPPVDDELHSPTSRRSGTAGQLGFAPASGGRARPVPAFQRPGHQYGQARRRYQAEANGSSSGTTSSSTLAAACRGPAPSARARSTDGAGHGGRPSARDPTGHMDGAVGPPGYGHGEHGMGMGMAAPLLDKGTGPGRGTSMDRTRRPERGGDELGRRARHPLRRRPRPRARRAQRHQGGLKVAADHDVAPGGGLAPDLVVRDARRRSQGLGRHLGHGGQRGGAADLERGPVGDGAQAGGVEHEDPPAAKARRASSSGVTTVPPPMTVTPEPSPKAASASASATGNHHIGHDLGHIGAPHRARRRALLRGPACLARAPLRTGRGRRRHTRAGHVLGLEATKRASSA